jgi:hypothetical protein
MANKKPALTNKLAKPTKQTKSSFRGGTKSLPDTASSKAKANAFGKKGAAMRSPKSKGKGDVSAYV